MKILKILLIAFIFINQACKNNAGEPIVIIDSSNAYKPVFKIYGIDTSTAFTYTFSSNISENSSSIICDKYISGDTISIVPKFTLNFNEVYKLRISYAGSAYQETAYSTPKRNTNLSSEVVTIYPNQDTIPTNILMFHVLFNDAMEENPIAFRHVKLLDENNHEKQMVWREKSNWTQDGKHLVLMIHPGRVKRGIRYMIDSGQLFEPGKKYTLVITDSLLDSHGNRMAKEYRKTFVIKEEDRTIPEANSEQIDLPEAGTKEPITITFNDAMDYGGMQIGVNLLYLDSIKVQGKITTDNGKQWHYTPSNEWEKGSYTLILNDYVIDLASNHLNRRFEETDIELMKNRKDVKINFTID